MSENKLEQRPYYFNLKADGDSAIVRFLHSNPSTIENVVSHRVTIGDKQKRVKCTGEHCPLCAKANTSDNRIYIHLFDYTDNTNKVWERTDKILPQIEKLFKSWSPLNSAVVKITRKGNEFPKYDIEPQNPMNYENVDNSLIDNKLAFRYMFNRKDEDIKTFIDTGKFPEKAKYIPKSDYEKQQKVEQSNVSNEVNSAASSVTVNTDPLDDPFMKDFFTKPRKV